MKKNEENILLSIPVDMIANEITERLLGELKNLKYPSSVSMTISKEMYLTRKEAYTLLRVSGPTLDSYANINLIEKIGVGKRARFRKSDIENLYENIAKFKYKPGLKIKY